MFKWKAEKPIPKRTVYKKYGFVLMEYVQQLCPRCWNVLNAGPNYKPRFCSECGQKIDFSETVWEDEKEIGYVRGVEIPSYE